MSLADSIRQTASIIRWVSEAVTAADHTIFDPSVEGRGSAGHLVAATAPDCLAGSTASQPVLESPDIVALAGGE